MRKSLKPQKTHNRFKQIKNKNVYYSWIWKFNIMKMPSLPKLQICMISVKMSIGLFFYIKYKIHIAKWRNKIYQETSSIRGILGDITLPNIKTYYKTSIIKAVYCWCRPTVEKVHKSTDRYEYMWKCSIWRMKHLKYVRR